MMDKEDYVSLEVAKLLKEKGYNEECGCYYNIEEECYYFAPFIDGLGTITYRQLPDVLLIPTLYEAQKWLRELYKIHICVDCHANGWYCRLYDIPYGEFILQTDGYEDSYEEALNVGILEALKLI